MTTWERETIEHHNVEKGTVFVFRSVPTYALFDGRRKQHPTFNEWLDDMLAASAGLEGPMPSTRMEWGDTVYGVDGHRQMTDSERAAYAETLRGEIAYREKCLNAISTGGTSETATA